MDLSGLNLVIPERADVERDAAAEEWARHGGQVVRVGRFSTFKIPHTLFALDSGVVSGFDHRYSWDAKRDPGEAYWPASWKREHTLASAFRHSVLWYYQRVARAIGPRRMQGYLERCGYGNRRTGESVDQFWLGGGLEISPDEQVVFLRGLYQHHFDFPEEHFRGLLEVMELERQPSWVLYGKTGSGPEGAGLRFSS